MKKVILILFISIPILSFSQTKEIYGGVNYSNCQWINNSMVINSINYNQGYQAGIIWGNKETNIFKKRKIIKTGIALEYNYLTSSYNLSDSTNLSQSIETHNTRLSFPIKLRIGSILNKRVGFYFLVEPGFNFIFYQNLNIDLSFNDRLNPFNTFVNPGLVSIINLGKKEQEKSGYRFSSLFISASKYIQVNPFSRTSTSSYILDQFNLSAGLIFSYQKEKSKLFKKKKK